jgi:hypothetical protein
MQPGKRTAPNSPSGDQEREPKRLRLATDLWSEEEHRKKDEEVRELLAETESGNNQWNVNDRIHMASVLRLVGDLVSNDLASPQFRVPAKFNYIKAINEDPDLMKLVGDSYLSGSYKDLRRLGVSSLNTHSVLAS